MPSTGIHGITGIIAASLIPDEYGKLGAVIGSIIPDSDLLIGSIGYILTRNVDVPKKIHRTFTHSYVIHLGIALLGSLIFFTGWNSIGIFLMCMAMMMAVHSTTDFCYVAFMNQKDYKNGILPGIAIFAPMSMKKKALFAKVFSDKIYNVLLSLDFIIDPIIFYTPVLYLAWAMKSEFSYWSITIIITSVFAVIFTAFFIYAITGNCKPEKFVVAIYYPGIFFLLFTLSIPFIFNDIFQRLEWINISQLFF